MLCCATVPGFVEGRVAGVEDVLLGGTPTYSVLKYCHVSVATPFLMEPRCTQRRVLDPLHTRVLDRTTARAIQVLM